MRISPLALLPPALFAALAMTFYIGMQRSDPDGLPSTRVGQEAPAVPVEGLPGLDRLLDADLRTGAVTVVNFWASWCPPCRAEHPELLAMEKRGIRVAGVNIRDEAGAATGYLARDGNPFFATGFDPTGRSSIDWGVTAPPETFIVDGTGKVLFRFAGPLVGSFHEQAFVPALEAALAE